MTFGKIYEYTVARITSKISKVIFLLLLRVTLVLRVLVSLTNSNLNSFFIKTCVS